MSKHKRSISYIPNISSIQSIKGIEPEQLENTIRDFHNIGLGYDEISSLLGISRTTLWRLRKQLTNEGIQC